jgi:transposase-like protein
MDIIVESATQEQTPMAEGRELMPVCPFCYSRNMRKYGFYYYGKKKKQKWLCENCQSVTAFPLHRKPTERKKRS